MIGSDKKLPIDEISKQEFPLFQLFVVGFFPSQIPTMGISLSNNFILFSDGGNYFHRYLDLIQINFTCELNEGHQISGLSRSSMEMKFEPQNAFTKKKF